MIDRIRELERKAQLLEPDAGHRALLRDKVMRYAEAYVENLTRSPAYRAAGGPDPGLMESPISDAPLDIDDALELLKNHVDNSGVMVGAKGYMAYIPASGLYVAALGDYLAAVTNRYSGLFFASPGAVRVDRLLLDWMAKFIGFPETAAGDLTSGGSIANLTGIVTARDACCLKAVDFPRSVVYLSSQTHHSIEKALRIAGLEECPKRLVPLDPQCRMRAEALDEFIVEDAKKGLNPWLIVASAGTTDLGAVDPLRAIADVAAGHKLWLHVDGAYGGMFALCEPGKRMLKGIERSDSLILDPHKGLFMPLGSGAVLVRDGEKLASAHRYTAGYMQDKDVLASPDEISPADLSPELTRPFRGLRLWLALKLAGVAPFRAALEEKMWLARFFHEEVRKLDGFVPGPPPELSIVTFRYHPRRGDPDEFNRRLIHAVQTDGRIFLSSTTVDGIFTLRLAVLGFRTHLDTVESAVRILRDKAREIEAEQ